MVLDGVECRQGSRPDVASKAAPYNCVAASNGCAQPKAAAAGEDGDFDLLYKSGDGSAANNLTAERFYRTMSISRHDGTEITDTDGDSLGGIADKDSDADWNVAKLPGIPSDLVLLQDGIEVRFYGTAPSNADTDTDGCDDAREVGDTNGDRIVASGDTAILAGRTLLVTLSANNLDNGKGGDITAGDGKINPNGVNYDVNKDKTLNAGDVAILAFSIAKGGNCQNNRQQGLTPGRATKLPF
jgi:hypothetical protein